MKKIAITIPIHEPYFQFGINLVYSSLGAEYDLHFIFSNTQEKINFQSLFPEVTLNSFKSHALTDFFNDLEINIISQKKV